ncbi:MAG: cyclic pyranopterin monophosphate synthase MoaC, partial [Planctomycetia bacterium]
RSARAPATAERIRSGTLDKGDAIAVARLAGVMAAKRTADIVPLCHPLPLDAVEMAISFAEPGQVVVEAVVRTTARTGVEMEALTAVTAAALTIYDMCKSIDRGMAIEEVRLDSKTGGQSGDYVRS